MIDVSNQATVNSPRYLDRTRNESRTEQTEALQSQTLQSEATTREQQQRDTAAANNGLLETQAVVIKPDAATIKQLESTTQAPENASGLGRTAISSYQSLASAEQSQNLAGRVKVDITA